MTLPLTWDQMPLTVAQQTAAQQLAAWGAANDGTPPPVTYSQIKNFRLWIVSLNALVGPAHSAMTKAAQYYQNGALAAYDAANP